MGGCMDWGMDLVWEMMIVSSCCCLVLCIVV